MEDQIQLNTTIKKIIYRSFMIFNSWDKPVAYENGPNILKYLISILKFEDLSTYSFSFPHTCM